MGCWGIGNFQNDDAMDWAGELQEHAGIGAVTRVFGDRRPEDYIEAPYGSVYLAAAEVVAALLGRPSGDLPVEVARWISENRGHDVSAFRGPALELVRAILAGNSELRVLWEENEGDYPFWKATQESLIARLEAAGN